MVTIAGYRPMTKVSATEFQNQVGRYIDAAQREPVTVTSHGRDRVVLVSPELYHRLTGGVAFPLRAYRLRDAPTSNGRPERLKDPVAIALSVVNTSTPQAVNRRELRDAIRNPRSKHRAHARLLLDEVNENVLAGMVARKFVTWADLARLANRAGIGNREKETLIRQMAGLALD
jgi:prevent-host-death family protein